jgi:hypothetical protein
MRLLDSIEYEQFNVPVDAQDGRTVAALQHLLEVNEALELDLRRLVSPRVLAWYRGFGLAQARTR